MTSAMSWAMFAGLTLGFGLWCLVSLVPVLNRPRLMHRVAPHVVDVSAGARELLARRAVNPLPVLGTLVGPLVERLQRMLGAALGGTEEIQRRLRQSGSTVTVEGFRARQLTWAAAGVAIGTGVSFAAARMQGLAFAGQVAVVVGCGVGGIVLADSVLKRAAKARLARMAEELPTVLEFLTLSLSAGEGILDAVRRISRISRGELAVELAGTVAAVSAGMPFAATLRTLADEVNLPPLTRAVEQIVGALERGTPLAEVLRAQAQDARDDAKRSMLETAGKKEVAMLLPLVFLILPITVIFAVFPGLFVLRLDF